MKYSSCAGAREVSESRFYAFLKHPMCERKREDGVLAKQIVTIFEAHKGVYGSPRIHSVLKDQGVRCGRKRVVRLMRENDLCAHFRIHRVTTTRANPQAQIQENVLDRQFEAEEPNKKWVADVTYIATAQGWMYLAIVLDLYSRRVVGWAMANTFDESLVEQAMQMALTERKPEAGLLHHSDRGCQYTSEAYQAFLHTYGIQVSMSRKGKGFR